MATNAENIRMKDVLTKDAYDVLTAEERRYMLRWIKAQEYAGIHAYPTTCGAVCDTVRECFDTDMLNALTWKQLGEVLKLAKHAYDKGVAYGRERSL